MADNHLLGRLPPVVKETLARMEALYFRQGAKQDGTTTIYHKHTLHPKSQYVH
jgi:hypothetical protein